MLATTIHKSNTTPHHQRRSDNNQTSSQEADPTRAVKPPPVSHNRDEEVTGLLSQSPIVCLMIPSPENPAELNPVPAQRLSCTRTTPTTGAAHPSNRPSRGDPRYAGRLGSRGAP